MLKDLLGNAARLNSLLARACILLVESGGHGVAANVLPHGPGFGGGVLLLTLESRLGLLRRRRRVDRYKQLLTLVPMLLGASIILLLAYAGMASSR